MPAQATAISVFQLICLLHHLAGIVLGQNILPAQIKIIGIFKYQPDLFRFRDSLLFIHL